VCLDSAVNFGEGRVLNVELAFSTFSRTSNNILCILGKLPGVGVVRLGRIVVSSDTGLMKEGNHLLFVLHPG